LKKKAKVYLRENRSAGNAMFGDQGSLLSMAQRVVFFLTLALPFAPQLAVAQQGPVLELVEVKMPATVPEGFTVADGAIQFSNPNYSAKYTWNSPPKRIDQNGFTLTLGVAAQATASNLAAETSVHLDSTFVVESAKMAANVFVNAGESKSDSATLLLKPAQGLSPGAMTTLNIGASFYTGIDYIYRVVDPANGSGSGSGSQQPPQTSQLSATLDCPDSIVISAPDLNCHLLISGFRRNTADAVQVILPDALDTFGNHANGIQLDQLAGEQDVYNWDDTYSWGFFAFACPSETHSGHNCYANIATPGAPAVVPIIVQQGQDTVRVNLTFNVLPAKSKPATGSLGPSGNVVRIGNRWIAGSFINIEGGAPADGPIVLDWLSARWSLDPVPGTGFIRLHSVWKPDQYLNIEGGTLSSGPVDPDAQSAMWQLQPIGDSGYYLIQNVGDPNQYLNTQTQQLQSSPIQDDWLSADWWLLR
jgi:hypothetical protein